jgi:hypothetical protein
MKWTNERALINDVGKRAEKNGETINPNNQERTEFAALLMQHQITKAELRALQLALQIHRRNSGCS